MSGKGEPMLDNYVVKMSQIENAEIRTLEDLEAGYKNDPLAGLRDLIARVEELERWKADWDSRLMMSPKKEE